MKHIASESEQDSDEEPIIPRRKQRPSNNPTPLTQRKVRKSLSESPPEKLPARLLSAAFPMSLQRDTDPDHTAQSPSPSSPIAPSSNSVCEHTPYSRLTVIIDAFTFQAYITYRYVQGENVYRCVPFLRNIDDAPIF
jgi:hypothetical protein